MEETHHCATHWGHWGKTSPCPGETPSLVSRCIEFISKMPGQAWSTGALQVQRLVSPGVCRQGGGPLLGLKRRLSSLRFTGDAFPEPCASCSIWPPGGSPRQHSSSLLSFSFLWPLDPESTMLPTQTQPHGSRLGIVCPAQRCPTEGEGIETLPVIWSPSPELWNWLCQPGYRAAFSSTKVSSPC